MLNVFVPREVKKGENRVAATPETVRHMGKLDVKVTIEAGAGEAAGIGDAEFRAAGAEIATDAKAAFSSADLVLKVDPPEERDGVGHEADLMNQGSCLVSFLYPALNEELVQKLAGKKITSFAMDLVPRITRAQKMDALSSQSNIAGYKCVIMAADRLGKIFPLLMTAAGTTRPVKVVIIGAGVAGLQAIATAKRLGAQVEVNDIRPAVKEQVESLGGRFIDMPTPEQAESEGGYAREVSEEFLAKQREILSRHIAAADVVITTALVPGKPAPKLVSREMVEGMHAGSVIIDLGAAMGGNCELTKPGEIVVHEGVSIVGEANVPSLVPFHSSEMYARNILEVVRHLVTEGAIRVDMEDDIDTGSIATHEGEIRVSSDS